MILSPMWLTDLTLPFQPNPRSHARKNKKKTRGRLSSWYWPHKAAPFPSLRSCGWHREGWGTFYPHQDSTEDLQSGVRHAPGVTGTHTGSEDRHEQVVPAILLEGGGIINRVGLQQMFDAWKYFQAIIPSGWCDLENRMLQEWCHSLVSGGVDNTGFTFLHRKYCSRLQGDARFTVWGWVGSRI